MPRVHAAVGQRSMEELIKPLIDGIPAEEDVGAVASYCSTRLGQADVDERDELYEQWLKTLSPHPAAVDALFWELLPLLNCNPPLLRGAIHTRSRSSPAAESDSFVKRYPLDAVCAEIAGANAAETACPFSRLICCILDHATAREALLVLVGLLSAHSKTPEWTSGSVFDGSVPAVTVACIARLAPKLAHWKPFLEQALDAVTSFVFSTESVPDSLSDEDEDKERPGEEQGGMMGFTLATDQQEKALGRCRGSFLLEDVKTSLMLLCAALTSSFNELENFSSASIVHCDAVAATSLHGRKNALCRFLLQLHHAFIRSADQGLVEVSGQFLEHVSSLTSISEVALYYHVHRSAFESNAEIASVGINEDDDDSLFDEDGFYNEFPGEAAEPVKLLSLSGIGSYLHSQLVIRQNDAPPELHADHYGALRDTWSEADEVVVRCFPAILMLLLSGETWAQVQALELAFVLGVQSTGADRRTDLTTSNSPDFIMMQGMLGLTQDEHRRLAFQTLQILMDMFDEASQFCLIRALAERCPYADVKSNVIMSMLHQRTQRYWPRNKGASVTANGFASLSLIEFLQSTLMSTRGSVLRDAELILTTMNVLMFAIGRDRRVRATELFDHDTGKPSEFLKALCSDVVGPLRREAAQMVDMSEAIGSSDEACQRHIEMLAPRTGQHMTPSEVRSMVQRQVGPLILVANVAERVLELSAPQ